MIICGPRGIGKTILAKTNKNYVDFNFDDFKKENANKTSEDLLKSYVNTACLLSDVGMDVLMLLTDEVVAQLYEKKATALLVLNSSVPFFKILTIYNVTEADEYLHAYLLPNGCYLTEDVVSKFKNMDIFKKNSSKDTIVWGLTMEGKDATVYTDNAIVLMKEKATGEYYVLFDDNILEENDPYELQYLIFKLTSWYNNNEPELKEEYHIRLKDIYDSLSLTSGKTIAEVILKLKLLTVLV